MEIDIIIFYVIGLIGGTHTVLFFRLILILLAEFLYVHMLLMMDKLQQEATQGFQEMSAAQSSILSLVVLAVRYHDV